MERLTETIYKKGYCNSKNGCELLDCEQCDHFETMIDRLAYYEELEEQGLLLRLPCKVGEEVYCIKNGIDGYAICRNRVLSYQTAPKEIGGILARGYMGVTLGIVGKNVFATYEEAEKKLAEMRKE